MGGDEGGEEPKHDGVGSIPDDVACGGDKVGVVVENVCTSNFVSR